MSIDLNPSESEIDPQKTTTFSQTSQKENPFFAFTKAKQESLEYHILGKTSIQKKRFLLGIARIT